MLLQAEAFPGSRRALRRALRRGSARVAYFSQTRKGHIKIHPDLQRQYQTVYAAYDPLLPDFPALESNFLDLRGALDREGHIYIDADHAGRTATSSSPRRSAIS